MGNFSTRFQKGRSGNPNGRKKGSRNKLSEKFIADVAKDWSKRGKMVLDNVRALQPGVYLKVVAGLIAKDYVEEEPDNSGEYEGAKEKFLRELMRLRERSINAAAQSEQPDGDKGASYDEKLVE